VVWNGLMGVFEIPEFALAPRPSRAVAAVGDDGRRRRRSSRHPGKVGVADQITHISTGGGASLEPSADRNCPAWRPSRQIAMRHPFIAGNWKMFKTVHDTVVS
jgi:3-phosphoglycerate kinase